MTSVHSPEGSAGSIVFRGAYLLTQDPHFGEQRADLLIEGSVIRAIGRNLVATNAENIDAADYAVIPGFVDTHRHTWQTALRGLATGASLDQYQTLIQGTLGSLFTPEDVYAGNLLGAMSAAQTGVTTLCDESHVQNSPAHSDAAVRALKDSRIRAVFDYGWPSIEAKKWMVNSSLTHPTYVRELQQREFTDQNQLVTLRMMLRGPLMTPVDITRLDLNFARGLGLRSAMHVIGGNIQTLSDSHLLQSDLMLIHCCDSSDQELRLAAAAGATVSSCPSLEMSMCGFGKPPPLSRFVAAGLRPSLSIDVESAMSGDMFSVMRAALMAPVVEDLVDPSVKAAAAALSAADILSFATIHGAESCGLQARIGSLTPGKQADLVMIRMSDHNLSPFDDNTIARQIVSCAHPGNVATVMVEGRFIRRNSQPVDNDALLHATDLGKHSRKSLLRRANIGIGA